METDKFPPDNQRAALVKFLVAIKGRKTALRRDEYADWAISGKRGHIYAVPEGFQLAYFARYGVNEHDGDGPHLPDYAAAKRKLVFCKLAQDGTGEGIFFLDRLPDDAEAESIRDVFQILRAVQYSEETLTAMRERAKIVFGHGAPST
ncbi:MAG: hypothetical protein L0Y60_04230 [Beijerinckiaceae bacterium]|nr:hypothetical protein [Beijerinckiaceae bacterium]